MNVLLESIFVSSTFGVNLLIHTLKIEPTTLLQSDLKVVSLKHVCLESSITMFQTCHEFKQLKTSFLTPCIISKYMQYRMVPVP